MKILLRFVCIYLTVVAFGAAADVKLPRLVSDGMVLQRDKPVHIWGWADEGEEVTVTLGKQTLSTKAQAGRWQLTFKPLAAGGPYVLDIQGKNHLQVKDVLFGDVWIASGQSNMELPLRRVKYQYLNLIESTHLPRVREFNVPVIYNFKGPVDDYPQGEWKAAEPANLSGFSAVGFFFSRALHEKLKAPIGLITIPVGGSPAEAWVSEAGLAKYPHYLAQLQPFKSDEFVAKTIATDKAASAGWYADLAAKDEGLKGNWSNENLDTKDWKNFTVPGYLKEQGSDFIQGAVWFRKSFNLTAEQASKAATLWMGVIVDGDQVFLNGKEIGQTGYKYPPRIYSVPSGLLKAGKNTISIRVTSYTANAGFVKEKRYELDLGSEAIPLAGDWQYKIAARTGDMPKTTTLQYQPASLFNAKLAPTLGLAIKGVIWYQGESNTTRAKEYETLMPDLISDWRGQFKQGDFPFIFVQLANFMDAYPEPRESDWAATREAQRKTLSVKNTAMVVASDVGEWNDIHPLNKQAVGERLALAAQRIAYGNKKIVTSPNAINIKRDKKSLIVGFDKAGGDLEITKDGVLHHIAIAGADKKYVWAKAKLQGNKLVVWSDDVAEPVSVRYAWADNPEGANLYNKAGLPASPFELSLQ
ncbi:9-O-acetylesterase [Cellvibrio zantedeschiae]|uniref:9-O-acetylesterase n=1 Tax=Cellvibrio zantedeschiae TaxID=1237077 RepID=A0ABQ3B404_9GAMM|nr:sialate O-acetylesterase [Cellvibrio zantedeschiae]GGY77339.1 9-O-acetylesterase [Cellvibrio zantedeschiae]